MTADYDAVTRRYTGWSIWTGLVGMALFDVIICTPLAAAVLGVIRPARNDPARVGMKWRASSESPTGD